MSGRAIFYTLDERHRPIPQWMFSAAYSAFMAGPGRIVRQDRLADGTFVSTVFLGIDHNWTSEGPPILFETMIFAARAADGEAFEDFERRHCTWDEALEYHRDTMAALGHGSWRSVLWQWLREDALAARAILADLWSWVRALPGRAWARLIGWI